MKYWIGVDPGINGALAMIDDNGDPYIWDLSDHIWDTLILRGIMNQFVMCGVEKQQAFPGQGSVSTFHTGYGFGRIIGNLEARCIPLEIIRPQDWQQFLEVPDNPPENENKAQRKKRRKREYADKLQELYPMADFNGPRGGFRDGRSDALGIAHYTLHNV